MLCVLTFTSHVHKTHAAILNESGDCLAESSLYLEEKKKHTRRKTVVASCEHTQYNTRGSTVMYMGQALSQRLRSRRYEMPN